MITRQQKSQSVMLKKTNGGYFRLNGSKNMDYKNDNRTPRDRITGEFLSELLFSESGGDCDCEQYRSGDRITEKASVRVSRNDVPVCKCTENNRNRNNCGCTTRTTARGGKVEFAGEYSLAMAYVPMQQFRELHDMEVGFCEGTIFKELTFPFYPTPCRKGADCCDK